MIRKAMLGIASALVLAGCPHDDHEHGPGGHTSPYPSCNEITQACHSVDVEEGPIHDCHDQAHAATSDPPCAQIKAQCLMICFAAADGGGKGDGGGPGDAGHDGP
jgi:hypothetical protein